MSKEGVAVCLHTVMYEVLPNDIQNLCTVSMAVHSAMVYYADRAQSTLLPVHLVQGIHAIPCTLTNARKL